MGRCAGGDSRMVRPMRGAIGGWTSAARYHSFSHAADAGGSCGIVSSPVAVWPKTGRNDRSTRPSLPPTVAPSNRFNTLRPSVTRSAHTAVPFMLALAYVAVLAALALVIAALTRERRGPAHYAFAAGMAIVALEGLLIGHLAGTPTGPEALSLLHWRLGLLALVPAPWIAFSLTYSRGNARNDLTRWRWTLLGILVLPAALAGLGYRELAGVDSTSETGEVMVLGLAGFALHLIALVGSVFVLTNLERTFRSAAGTLRWRIKLTMIGMIVLFGCRIYTDSQALLYRVVNPSLDLLNVTALLTACLLIAFSLARTQVFAIEIDPSPTVLRHSIVLVLAGVYLLVVGFLARIVTELGGTTAFPARAFLVLVALAGLTLLLVSDRVRQGAHQFVSRHLHRPSYDYRHIWQTFSSRLTPQVTVPDLSNSVARWCSDTLQVLSATVWVVDDARSRLVLGGSTVQTEALRCQAVLAEDELTALASVVIPDPTPLNLEQANGTWAVTLRQRSLSEFPDRGGPRWLVPLVTGVELVGVIILADRVNGLLYTTEDLDLLKCVGDQVAGQLLALRLSQRLLQSRELEAFQTMSAFFVHDLKNTASTLSLMLQNLPRHFDNPDFRRDALGSLRRCVDRIDNQVAQLSALRKGLELDRQPADLNQLVGAALEPLAHTAGSRIVRDLQPLPVLALDTNQTLSIITNLVLNALDATGDGDHGEVRIATAQQNGSVQLSVTDNGCGMSPDFIRESLFRPFRTTKKHGTGLGLYQCKMIAEAHGGRTEVESELGKGTVVRVVFEK